MSGSTKYYLTTNIDLQGVTWTPITSFTGVLDGNDFTISNLTINSPSSDNQGLFGTVGDGVEIYDLTLEGFSVTGDDYVAALIARHNAEGSILIKNVDINDCTLSGSDLVAPVIGAASELTGGDIYDVNVSGLTLTATDVSCGGMFGDMGLDSSKAAADVNITDCNTSGTMTFDGSDAGSYCGGFAGIVDGTSSYDFNFHTCFADVNISWTDSGDPSWVGGFIANADDCNFVTCYSTGDIDFSVTSAPSTITGIGGFVGFETGNSSNYIDCYATGNLTLDATDVSTMSLIGGFGGKWDVGAAVLRCYSTGDITFTGMDENISWLGVGGFIGGHYSDHTVSNTTLQRSWAEGDVTLNHEGGPNSGNKGGVGGFIGEVYHNGNQTSSITHTIQNCYAWGSVLITNNPGSYDMALSGFIGTIDYIGNYPITYILLNLYDAQTDTAVGSGYSNQLTNVSDANGLVGWVEGSTTITEPNDSLFWDTETSGITTDVYATGHTTMWMQTKQNFLDAGWNFDTIWTMPVGTVNTYFYLNTMNWSGVDGLVMCVYADGRPIGNFTVSDGSLDLGAQYTVVIAGINYYSTYESFPLIIDTGRGLTSGENARIMDISIDFYESMACNVGVDRTNSTDWLFSRDSFATAIDPVTGYKQAPFTWGTTRDPVVHCWVWIPVPMTIRGIYLKMEAYID
jgi:hypothetical protein